MNVISEKDNCCAERGDQKRHNPTDRVIDGRFVGREEPETQRTARDGQRRQTTR
jgi:hypothetical protein